MHQLERMMATHVRRFRAPVVGAALIAASFALSAPSASAHVGNVPSYSWDSYKWSANVLVDYGQSQAVTECSNGVVYHGAWVGQGYWAFGWNCADYGATLVDFWIDNR
ncbi:hypothetical protein ABZ770_32075 [Streptomyces sp. NPDC006654]|uniref:hypothetical protein n=1 Tax=unclassified Streptomyces TaxID=2593676 RepID=UPI003405D8C7